LTGRVQAGKICRAMFLRKFVPLVLLLTGLCSTAFAQGLKQELEAPEKVNLSVKNLDGKVSVVAKIQRGGKPVVLAYSAEKEHQH